jgi:hypothetical protein
MFTKIGWLIMGLVFCMMANAEDDDPAMIKLSGFGTLGVSHSSEKRGDYVLDSTLPKGVGLSNNWGMGNDSRLGLQALATFTPKTTAVLQVISEYQFDNTYRPVIEWANVKHEFTPDFYVRAGRIALPTFLNSDTRKVGYSYPWIHPPVELYRQLAITNSDGMDAMYRFDTGEASHHIKMLVGNNTIDRLTSISTARNLWGVFDTIELDALTLHIGYQQRESASYNRLTGITGAWVKNFDLSVGGIYDTENWFIASEWMQRESTTKRSAMYVSAGYRLDKFTPFVTYSQDNTASFLPNAPAPTAATIVTALRSQRSTSIGARWDFMKNVDLKLQYDLIKLGDNSNGYLANVPLNTPLNGAKFHLISAVVDFVF